MAATRAAQLTEAYRTLMNPELRSEYDRQHAAAIRAAGPAAADEPAGRTAFSSSCTAGGL